MAKDRLQRQEAVMHFLKSNSIVLCTGGELDGLTQLVPAEMVFKIQTLHMCGIELPTSGGGGPCRPRLAISTCSVNIVVPCVSRKTLILSRSWGGDVRSCAYDSMRPKDLRWRKPPQSDDVHAGWVCRYHFQIGQDRLVWEFHISYLEESL